MKHTLLALAVAATSSACLLQPHPGPHGPPGPLEAIPEDTRLDTIRRAAVWRPTDTARLDLLRGPQGPESFAPGATVTCDFVDRPHRGTTPKFHCAISPEDTVKVKYGANEGEIYAEPVATRLFWALGFGANAEYRVTVRCRNCPADPWGASEPRLPEVTFPYAMIERDLPGETIAHQPDEGWSFHELYGVDATAGGATVAERDALLLLAAFVQHSDNSRNNQRLVCPPEAIVKTGEGARCRAPFAYVNDLGSTFGRGNMWHQKTTARADFREWSRVPVWADASRCRARLHAGIRSPTLEDPHVSEAGRQFLAERLARLSDAQIRDLFAAGSIDKRGWSDPHGASRNGTLDQWVEAFKRRRAAISEVRCPS